MSKYVNKVNLLSFIYFKAISTCLNDTLDHLCDWGLSEINDKIIPEFFT